MEEASTLMKMVREIPLYRLWEWCW